MRYYILAEEDIHICMLIILCSYCVGGRAFDVAGRCECHAEVAPRAAKVRLRRDRHAKVLHLYDLSVMIHCRHGYTANRIRAGYAAPRLFRRASRVAEQRRKVIQQVVVVGVDPDRHLVRL